MLHLHLVGELGGVQLNRITGGRLLGLEWVEGRVRLVGADGSAGVEADEDAAAATVALRIALAELLETGPYPLDSLVLGDPFDTMDAEDQLRAAELLRGLLPRVPQILLLTRGGVVDRVPECFDAVYEARVDAGETVVTVRSLPAGVGVLRLPEEGSD